MSQPMVGHRSEEFKRILIDVAPRLKPIFGTEQEVMIITGTGTSALEASVVNTLSPGDQALVLVTGAFGDRFVKLCETYGVNIIRLDIEWGQAVQPEHVKDVLLAHPQTKAVFVTHCETSTGVLNPIRDIASVIHQHSDALVVVDGVSSVGGVEIKMDEWGIDILVSGSQKAMMLPTGLAFIAVSERAWHVIEANQQPRFYLDLCKYKKSYAEHSTPFTPGVSLVMGLQESLNMFEEEGIERVFHRHQLLKKMTRAACKALDLPLFTSDQDGSPTVTAIQPSAFAAETFRKTLRKEFGMTLAGGQQHLKGQIFRIGHMGHCSALDVLQCIAAMECSMKLLQADVQLGIGVAAAQEVYMHEVSSTHQ